jgi:hypothetical protein
LRESEAWNQYHQDTKTLRFVPGLRPERKAYMNDNMLV